MGSDPQSMLQDAHRRERRRTIEVLSKPESIDRLALELAYIGIKVPPRDTAFFQAAVSKWLATQSDGEVK
jgi:hypothetical protein